ncbi:uncharacterized protein LOC115579694 isoform X1 [Xyrichtys novacula]|uniref:Uncharacterized protein LOC115579694 isoform X1 n=1 Tax=Xyrichtys novacula TaxID=13765 RepID=A0AAV1GDQ3_XYRNO|nr:uncharacterized protein LOC115579694 isoform X1 [Xyrichtys novacula]
MSLQTILAQSSTPYQRLPPLKVKVIALQSQMKVSAWEFAEGEARPLKVHNSCTAAVSDRVSVTKFILFQNLADKIVEGGSYIIKNYSVSKNGVRRSMLSCQDTNIFHTSLVEVPANVEEEGRNMICPPSQKLSLKDITANRDGFITVEGCVTSISKIMQIISQHGPPVPLANIRLKEGEVEVKVCLWRKATMVDLCVGTPCKMTHLRIKNSPEYGFFAAQHKLFRGENDNQADQGVNQRILR